MTRCDMMRAGAALYARRWSFILILAVCVSFISSDAMSSVASPEVAPGFGRVARITLSDLYADCDAALVQEKASARWAPPSQEYIDAHAGEPEHPDMRAEFGVWVKVLLADRWIPKGLVDSAVYLRRGTGRESRHHSHFYAAYEMEGCELLVQGFMDQIRVTAKCYADLPQSVVGVFTEAAALKEASGAGGWAVSRDYRDGATSELRSYLRSIAERYVNPACLPESDVDWQERLNAVSLRGDGFGINWGTHGHESVVRGMQTVDSLTGGHAVVCSAWTNGRAVRLVLDHGGVFVRDFGALSMAYPEPSIASVVPLNPQAVELWDMAQWNAGDGPVDSRERASSMLIAVVVRPPYAPGASAGQSLPERPGMPFWGNEIRLPMTPLKAHILEFAALAGGVGMSMWHDGCYQHDSFGEELGRAADREVFLGEARARRDACSAITERFAALRYPMEAQAERNELVAALQASVQAWHAALAFWGPVVQSYPDASETFYRLQGENLEKQLEGAGLTKVAERVGNAVQACGVPLFERYGLQNPR